MEVKFCFFYDTQKVSQVAAFTSSIGVIIAPMLLILLVLQHVSVSFFNVPGLSPNVKEHQVQVSPVASECKILDTENNSREVKR